MENAGIDYTFLSVPTPHIYNGDNRKASLAAKEINLSVARICQNYTNQFGFVACVPLLCVEGTIAELLYAMDELGAVGVKLATNPEPVTMDMLMMVAEDSHIVFGSNYPHSPANAIIAKKSISMKMINMPGSEK